VKKEERKKVEKLKEVVKERKNHLLFYERLQQVLQSVLYLCMVMILLYVSYIVISTTHRSSSWTAT
jgi:hypothetical protein